MERRRFARLDDSYLSRREREVAVDRGRCGFCGERVQAEEVEDADYRETGLCPDCRGEANG